MKMNTMQKLYDCIDKEIPEIILPEDVIREGRKPIDRMLEISRKMGLI